MYLEKVKENTSVHFEMYKYVFRIFFRISNCVSMDWTVTFHPSVLIQSLCPVISTHALIIVKLKIFVSTM